jgi:hypothetical protein
VRKDGITKCSLSYFQTRGSSPQIRFSDARGHHSSLQEDGKFIVSVDASE